MNSEIKYMIAGWPFGTLKNEWDLSHTVQTGNLWMGNYVNLVDKIEDGNIIALRTYKGWIPFPKNIRGQIFGICQVYNIEPLENGHINFKINNLEWLTNSIPIDNFYNLSHNRDSRSRIIRIDKHDSNLILN